MLDILQLALLFLLVYMHVQGVLGWPEVMIINQLQWDDKGSPPGRAVKKKKVTPIYTINKLL